MIDDISKSKEWKIVAEIEKQTLHTTLSATLKIRKLITEEKKISEEKVWNKIREIIANSKDTFLENGVIVYKEENAIEEIKELLKES